MLSNIAFSKTTESSEEKITNKNGSVAAARANSEWPGFESRHLLWYHPAVNWLLSPLLLLRAAVLLHYAWGYTEVLTLWEWTEHTLKYGWTMWKALCKPQCTHFSLSILGMSVKTELVKIICTAGPFGHMVLHVATHPSKDAKLITKNKAWLSVVSIWLHNYKSWLESLFLARLYLQGRPRIRQL